MAGEARVALSGLQASAEDPVETEALAGETRSYNAFLEDRSCTICRSYSQSNAVSIEDDDPANVLFSIPLCTNCEARLDRLGAKRLGQLEHRDLWREVAMLLALYFTEGCSIAVEFMEYCLNPACTPQNVCLSSTYDRECHAPDHRRLCRYIARPAL